MGDGRWEMRKGEKEKKLSIDYTFARKVADGNDTAQHY